MLNSIYLIGKEISQGRDPWADILTGVKASSKELEQKRYVLPVHFNLDTQTVEIDPVALFEYSDELFFLKKWCSLRTLKGHNKAIYLTVGVQKIELLKKTLFGNNPSDQAELLGALKAQGLLENASLLNVILKEIAPMQDAFLAWFQEDGENFTNYSLNKVEKMLGLKKDQTICQITATVTSHRYGLNNTFIGDLNPYRDFLSKKFFRNVDEDADNINIKEKYTGLCYATGQIVPDTSTPFFFRGYNINNYFVKTTKNYASAFQKINYKKNYQLSGEALQYLDRGSDYLLQNVTIQIAGIPHVIIPEFFSQEKIYITDLRKLNQKMDLLFGTTNWESLYTFLEDNTREEKGIYGINLLAIDSDHSKYFKAVNLIRDVSSLFLEQLFKTLSEVGKKYGSWLGTIYGFNLYSVYRVVPVQKKETINRALALMQAVLEQRTIDRHLLFDHFKELVLCHKYRRYKAYANIKERAEKDYPFALKDAVFTYLAFMEVLQRLNLLADLQTLNDMDTTKTIGQEEEDFLNRLAYTNEQAALFYLGRVLNRVVYEQSRKKHKKNALDKLNYNGMDGQAIFRLANELFESGRHYDITSKIVWPWGEFSRRFKLDGWMMNPAEALFYILSGYSFGIRSKKEDENEL